MSEQEIMAIIYEEFVKFYPLGSDVYSKLWTASLFPERVSARLNKEFIKNTEAKNES